MIQLGYVENFRSAIIKNSVAQTYTDAIKEWAYFGEAFDEDGQCCCGHQIYDNRVVRNRKNSNSLIVGNCCINKFGIERKAFNGSKMAYLELALNMVSSPGARDYLKYETLPRIKAGKKFTITDLRILKEVTGQKSRFRADEHEWSKHIQRQVNCRDRWLQRAGT